MLSFDQGPLLLAEALAAFLIDAEARGFSLRTIHLYQAEIGYFLTYAQDSTEILQDVTPTLLRQWLLHLGQTRSAAARTSPIGPSRRFSMRCPWTCLTRAPELPRCCSSISMWAWSPARFGAARGGKSRVTLLGRLTRRAPSLYLRKRETLEPHEP